MLVLHCAAKFLTAFVIDHENGDLFAENLGKYNLKKRFESSFCILRKNKRILLSASF